VFFEKNGLDPLVVKKSRKTSIINLGFVVLCMLERESLWIVKYKFVGGFAWQNIRMKM
jgi:hypothetical protein